MNQSKKLAIVLLTLLLTQITLTFFVKSIPKFTISTFRKGSVDTSLPLSTQPNPTTPESTLEKSGEITTD